MAMLFKFLAIFWAVWILWYITGGPLRDDKSKPFVNYNEKGQIEYVGTTTVK